MCASRVPSPGLVATPANAKEWKKAIQEVKRKYQARKYLSCSMQCCEILESLSDTSSIEPLHIIYLHFYAASSFEWCARPLSCSSAYRTQLLDRAKEHYAEAESRVMATEWNMAERARSPSSMSTTSLSSPGLSSDASTPSSSPRTSISSLDDDTPTKPVRPVRTKPKKSVSFSNLPEFLEFQPEPYIRPDSPTLGWEDYSFSAPPPPREREPCSAISPTTIIPSSIIKRRAESPRRVSRATTPEVEPDSRSRTREGQYQERSNTPSNHIFDLESFLQTRNLNRLRDQMSALREQISRHRSAVEDLLNTSLDDTPPATPIPQQEDEPEFVLHGLTPAPPLALRRQRSMGIVQHPRNNSLPGPSSIKTLMRPALRVQTTMDTANYPHLRRYNSVSAGLNGHYGSAASSMTPTSATAAPLSATSDDIRGRIERLRANGWQRKRFDGRRYEALREQVLGELDP
ncbi:hypothetical protein F4808DRAFT_165704 [Astrocystis sublimbata]|nr:hypothetical protein F4808DRAFT_165704 [Astrocystis sublimbata]